jgi:hypothetical protein
VLHTRQHYAGQFTYVKAGLRYWQQLAASRQGLTPACWTWSLAATKVHVSWSHLVCLWRYVTSRSIKLLRNLTLMPVFYLNVSFRLIRWIISENHKFTDSVLASCITGMSTQTRRLLLITTFTSWIYYVTSCIQAQDIRARNAYKFQLENQRR